MSVVLQGTFGSVVVSWWWEQRDEGTPIELRDRLAARAWLARAAALPGESAKLRRLAGERLAAPGHALDDEDLPDLLAGWIAAGELRLVSRTHGPLASWGAGEREEAEEAAAAEARRPAAPTTWITIELVGEDAKPIPGERYRIGLPDGSTREGRLDGNGLARVRGIDPGQCEVTFPDLDEEAWAPLRTTGEP